MCGYIPSHMPRHGVQQWLVKWKGYDADRNTWEPFDNLMTPEVVEEATKVREAALQPRTHEGLSKFVIAVLKAVLEARGLETSGNKAALVARLLAALVPQSSFL